MQEIIHEPLRWELAISWLLLDLVVFIKVLGRLKLIVLEIVISKQVVDVIEVVLFGLIDLVYRRRSIIHVNLVWILRRLFFYYALSVLQVLILKPNILIKGGAQMGVVEHFHPTIVLEFLFVDDLLNL